VSLQACWNRHPVIQPIVFFAIPHSRPTAIAFVPFVWYALLIARARRTHAARPAHRRSHQPTGVGQCVLLQGRPCLSHNPNTISCHERYRAEAYVLVQGPGKRGNRTSNIRTSWPWKCALVLRLTTDVQYPVYTQSALKLRSSSVKFSRAARSCPVVTKPVGRAKTNRSEKKNIALSHCRFPTSKTQPSSRPPASQWCEAGRRLCVVAELRTCAVRFDR